jgi:hypothetical protein
VSGFCCAVLSAGPNGFRVTWSGAGFERRLVCGPPVLSAAVGGLFVGVVPGDVVSARLVELDVDVVVVAAGVFGVDAAGAVVEDDVFDEDDEESL